jgi:hypothetical protein
MHAARQSALSAGPHAFTHACVASTPEVGVEHWLVPCPEYPCLPSPGLAPA